VSAEAVITRIAEMSTGGLWAIVALVAVVFAGVSLLMRQFLKNRQPGDRVRVKAPFFEIEAGPAQAPEAQLPEQRKDGGTLPPKPSTTSPAARSSRRGGRAKQG
jgi:hypothetical protein